MTHDCNGDEIKIGDEITLRCKVTSITEAEDSNHIDARIIDPNDERFDDFLPQLRLNSTLCRKEPKWYDSAFVVNGSKITCTHREPVTSLKYEDILWLIKWTGTPTMVQGWDPSIAPDRVGRAVLPGQEIPYEPGMIFSVFHDENA